ncbi:MAG TPA: glycosyltransferase family 9 protein [Gemmatimonadaceae bacterium]|nr:glycosyltransferase family 9 protein [Gemmatimonadaceae bacterium]
MKQQTPFRAIRVRARESWRKLTMSAVTALLPGSTGAASESLGSCTRPRRVLFVRYEKIGDLLLACGAIRAIAESSASTTVDVLAAPESAPLLRDNPFVRRVFTFDRHAWWTWPALWRRLRAEHYDIVVDGRINPERYFGTTPLLLAMAGAPVRIGAAGEGRERVYTHMVPVDPNAHFAEQSISVTRAFGIDPSTVDITPSIYLRSEERSEAISRWMTAGSCPDAARILVNVSAGGPRRLWPDDRYITAVRSVRALLPDATIMLIGCPADSARINHIAAASSAVHIPTRGIREAAALVANCDLVFTPDTAISHIAGALGVPVVVMMTSVPEARMVYSPDAFKPIGCAATIVRGPGPWLSDLGCEPVCAALETALDSLAARANQSREAVRS